MTTTTDLKNIASEGRRLIDMQLDVAEQIAALRDTATNKGVDWSALKMLLTAQAKDDRDDKGGNKRVTALLDRAGYHTDYAVQLGMDKDEREPETRSSSDFVTALRATPEIIADAEAIAPGEQHDPWEIPPALDRRKQANA